MKIKITGILLLMMLLGQSCSNGQSNKSINNKDMQRRIDFELLEAKAIKEAILGESYYEYTLEYEDSDGNWHKISGNKADGFIEWETPKLPFFHKVFSAYYGNGMLKLTGSCIGHASTRIGDWEYFDEKGNKIRQVNEDVKYGAYNYKKVLGFLNENEHINLETGEKRENLSMVYDQEKKIWYVSITDEFYMIIEYEIDGTTGAVINKKEYQGGME